MKTEVSEAGKSSSFPVVAIGAAEGGVDAISLLLEHLSPATGMAYVYVQSGIDGRASAETLAAKTQMPVREAAAGMEIEPNQFYLLPSGNGLSVSDDRFAKEDEEADGNKEAVINRFFTSLAENYKDIAIGVLLSGIDTDGAIGLKTIKISGGLTFAQDESAKFQSMPHGAIAEGAVDFILSPHGIAEELGKLGEQKEIYYTAIREMSEDAINHHDESFLSILKILNRSTGVDFSQYKMNTIKRRIIRRMMLFKLGTLKEYAQHIRQHPQEVTALYQDLLINVTAFFRDSETTDYLKKNLLPRLLKNKGLNDPVRVWVPACSTGQEPYSLAMLMMESLGENAAATPVQIFATDLSEQAVNKARLGIYTRDEVAGISPKRLQRFFTKIDGQYRIIKSIRDLCIFATHNIAKDPPFSRLDIISCCNLLIYLDAHLQKKVIATFHYSLVNNGYLILGKSETVGTSSYLFGQLEKKYKLYTKKKDSSAKAMFEMNYRMYEGEKPSGQQQRTKKNVDELDLEKEVDILLLKRFTPASVLVNADLDILQFRGSTGLYLEPSPGKASLNLLKMSRPGLGFELRNIVHKAKKSGEAVKREGLEISKDGKTYSVSVEALPIKNDGDENFFLVVFETVPPPPVNELSAGLLRDKRVRQLEAELTALREDMRSIVEAQEAANEELQSANEEVVSSNEELQSINEELETSKEEIESSNEELITINQELQIRNDQLAEAQEYSQAVFVTIRESLLILDKDLRIRAANAAFCKTFGVREEDIEGRLLYDLNNRQWDIPKLRELLEDIIPNNAQFQGFEIRHYFSGIGEKVLLLNARRVVQKIHGQQLLLLAIEDITEHKQAERIILEREKWFHNMADNAPVMIWLAGVDKLCTFVNQAFIDFRGESLEAAIGKPWYDGAHPDDVAHCEQIFDDSFREKKPFELTYRLQHNNNGYRTILTHAKPNFDADGIFLGYIGSCVEAEKVNGE